MTSLDIITH